MAANETGGRADICSRVLSTAERKRVRNMKITGLFLCFPVLLILAAAATKTGAQERKPDYVVEVQRSDGCLVSPVSIKRKSGFVIYALPRPDKIPPDSAGPPLTSKVFVTAEQRGEQWEVKVSIGTGEFYDAGDTVIGDFNLNLNERVSVTDMSRFGLSPIRVGVVKIVRQQAESPGFVNLTQSVSIESIETNDLPDPYKVRLRNASQADLVAFQYNTFRQQRFLALKWVSGDRLNPLLKAGQTYTLEVNSEDNSCGDAEGYRPKQSSRIDLVSAVFADGNYEGEPGLAALFKGTALGNRKNLERVVEVLRGAAADPAEVASRLSELRQGLNEETDPAWTALLHLMLPTMPANSTDALNGFIRSGMHQVKVSVECDVQYFEFVKQRKNPELTSQWLEQTKTKYERWLNAAERMTAH